MELTRALTQPRDITPTPLNNPRRLPESDIDPTLPKIIGPEYWAQFTEKNAQKRERFRSVHKIFMEIQAEAAIRDAAISAAARYLGKLIVCTTKSLGVIEGWCGRFEYYVNGLPRDYGNTLHIQKPSLPDATPIDIRELRKVELFDTDRLSFVWEGQSE